MVQVRPIDKNDHAWVIKFLQEHWGSTKLITRGKIHFADELPGFIALYGGKPAGLLLYHMGAVDCEIVAMNSLVEKAGIGPALLEAVKKEAVAAHCKRLWLVTTNDNVAAFYFYQKRGFMLVAIYRNAITQARQLKPEIPFLGVNDIPIRDEIELEFIL